MATNPMQRKAKNSFLLGVLITLLIAGIVIALLIIQLKNYKEREAEEQANSVKVWVLSQDVISGQIITTDMLKQQTINKNVVPKNAIGDMSVLSNYALEDKEGNPVITNYNDGVATLYLSKDGKKYELLTNDITGSYYYREDSEGNPIITRYKNNVETLYVSKNEKEYDLIEDEETGEYRYKEGNSSIVTINNVFVELSEVPLISKVDLNKNTIITVNMITKSNEKTTDDLRKQEYNMLVLPSQLETGEYVDVRITLPSGLDYVVISKKQVEIPQVNGVDVADTIWLKLNEDEILTMENAIIDAYRMLGSKLYVTRYVEAGMQNSAQTTYVPSAEVAELIHNNPNIAEDARNALWARYNANASIRNNRINGAITDSGEDGKENVLTKVQESITNTKESRIQYLESLAGY